MKKILFFTFYLFLFIFPVAKGNAADTILGPNTSPMIRPSYKLNDNNTVTVFWNQIPDVKEYRICLNDECPTKWYTFSSDQYQATFDLSLNETKRFWVHALLHDYAVQYNTLDQRSCCLNVKWADSFTWLSAQNFILQKPQLQQELLPSTTTTTYTTTTTTATTIVAQKNITPTTINYTQELIDRGIKPLSPTISSSTTTFPLKVTTTTILSTNQINKEQNMFGLNNNEFYVVTCLFVLLFVYILIIQINRSKMQRMRFQLEIKEKEFGFESKTYELKELAKAKLTNEHEATMKKIDADSIADKLQFTEKQLNNERNYNLEQQRINANNADKILEYVMPIIQRRDQHELRMAEIKSSHSLNSVLDTDDIKSGTVKFNIKK